MKIAIGSRGWSISQFERVKLSPLSSVMLIALGACLIWLGPSLSGFGALNGAWCSASDPSVIAQLNNFVWQATQHCPYCYIGAAFIGLGIFACDVGDFRRTLLNLR